MTICGGEIVVEDGRCTLVDEEKAMADAQAASDLYEEGPDVNGFGLRDSGAPSRSQGSPTPTVS